MRGAAPDLGLRIGHRTSALPSQLNPAIRTPAKELINIVRQRGGVLPRARRGSTRPRHGVRAAAAPAARLDGEGGLDGPSPVVFPPNTR